MIHLIFENTLIVLLKKKTSFQLAELEQRVAEAESRAEDAEDKVVHTYKNYQS